MKAIAVYPGKPHSMHQEDMPMPKITDIPDGQLASLLRKDDEKESEQHIV